MIFLSKRIFVVDDEKKINDLIKLYLLREGYAVEVFSDGLSAYKAFMDNSPDMLIVDVMMPEMDGYSLCRKIRKESNVPIIIVSAKDDEIDRILGLELGSDDYISKPFSPRELITRVKTIFRRVGRDAEYTNKEQIIIHCRDISILPEQRKVLKGVTEIKFTSKEYDFILHMVKNKNKVFTREQLINNIWGYDYIGDLRAIDDIVKRIRKKLAGAGSELEITTVWGYGYKINC